MITRGDPSGDDLGNEQKQYSPIEHINKYFMKLKRAREDIIENESGDECSAFTNFPEIMTAAPKFNNEPFKTPVLKQENWMIKRQEKNPSTANNEEASEKVTANTTAIAESSNPLAELEKRFPGFKKSANYLKLEQQSKNVIAKTQTLKQTWQTNVKCLKQGMKDTAAIRESHRVVKQQAANLLAKRVTSQGSGASIKDQESVHEDQPEKLSAEPAVD